VTRQAFIGEADGALGEALTLIIKTVAIEDGDLAGPRVRVAGVIGTIEAIIAVGAHSP
jgi:hypothetical protein